MPGFSIKKVGIGVLVWYSVSVVCCREYGRRRYRPDQQLEELRNIQEQLSQERLQWEQEKARQEKELIEKREQLMLMQASSFLDLQGGGMVQYDELEEFLKLSLLCIHLLIASNWFKCPCLMDMLLLLFTITTCK